MALTHHWKFDEGVGSTVADAVGARPFSLLVRDTFGRGRLSSWSLSGKAFITTYPVPTPPVTIAAWVRLKTNTGNVPLFGWWADQSTVTTQFAVWAQRTDGFGPSGVFQANIRLDGALQALGGVPLTLGDWAHVALAFDGTNAVVYHNGVAVGSAALSGALPTTNTVFAAHGDGADIEDLRVFDTVLNAAQVTTWMNTADEPAPTNPDPDPLPEPPPAPLPDPLPDAPFDSRFPLIESRALKNKLTGILASASTYATGREVPVHFVNPDFEIVQATYPGIYITYGAVSKASDREHRGPTLLGYAPPGLPTDVLVPADMDDKDSAATKSFEASGFEKESSPYYLPETPLPYNLDFNIGVLTRNYQQAFEIISQLQSREYLPERFGYLEVPEDGTIRTLELLGGPETSVEEDEDGKRLVQTLYSVRVAAELSLDQVEQVRRVAEVRTSLDEYL